MSPKIINSKGYRFLVAGKSYDRQEYSLLGAIAHECSARVEDVCKVIGVFENPNEAFAKATGLRRGTVDAILTSLKRRDTANRTAVAKAAAPRGAHDSCQACGRAWASGGGARICPVCVSEHRAKAAPAKPANRPPDPQRARATAAAERGAIVSTSAQYQKRMAEAARRR